MKLLTIIESPYNGLREKCGECGFAHNDYLIRCLTDSWKRGELPFASHGFFPLFLDEDDPADRNRGIEAGYLFWSFADQVCFYIDHGMSSGMILAEQHAKNNPIRCVYRSIGK